MNIYQMLRNTICHEYIEDANKTTYAMNIYKMLLKHHKP
jgi:hypothetical protein